MALDGDQGTGTLSGLSPEEAKEFHSVFMTSFIGFTVIAIVAHVLVWMWRPWLPPVGGYSSLMENTQLALSQVLPFIG